MTERICDICKKLTKRINLAKIRGQFFCKKCKEERRKQRQEETINQAGIRNELKELTRKQGREYYKAHHKKEIKEQNSEQQPIIKGSKNKKKKQKSNAYLTFEERKELLRMLMNRGMNFEDSKERINEIIEEQKRIRELMKEKNKSDEEIKIKQQKALEELWKY